jgi:hypothetical protein
MPIIDVVRAYPKQVLLAAGAFIVINAYFYILISYLISHATAEAGMSNSSIITVVLISSVVSFFAMPFFASLSDREGGRGPGTLRPHGGPRRRRRGLLREARSDLYGALGAARLLAEWRA